MLLDVSTLRLLTKDDFRVLRAIELGMRNHEIVPVPLIVSISKLRSTATTRSIKELLKHKLLHHENIQYDGYRLTNSGYDFLAIHTLVCRGRIHSFGRRIGTGKESDVYEVSNEDGEVMVMKIHRLGRTSFRAVKKKRDYLRHRRSFNWLYLSRLAALGEFAFMTALHKRGFPVPTPIDQNRHIVLMSVVRGYPLCQVKEVGNPRKVFEEIMSWFAKFVEVGLVHCDFNEFNLMIDEEEEITIIDFPQMVSIWHENAEELFNRDRECLVNFFQRKLHFDVEEESALEEICPEFRSLMERSAAQEGSLDQELQASGFKTKHKAILAKSFGGEELPSGDDDSSTESSTTESNSVECVDSQVETNLSLQQGEMDTTRRLTTERKKMTVKGRRRLKRNKQK